MSRRTLKPWDVQRVLHLRFTEHLGVEDVAAKLKCTMAMVAQICRAYQERNEPHAPSSAVHRRAGSRWGKGLFAEQK